jgi:hypothetical protein
MEGGTPIRRSLDTLQDLNSTRLRNRQDLLPLFSAAQQSLDSEGDTR